MENGHFFLQQGDLKVHKTDGGFKGISSIPSDAKVIKHKPLALGEATGHHHSVIDVDNYDLLEDDNGTLYLGVNEYSTLAHQEHNPITIPKGDYVVDIVQEFDHFKEEAKRVVD